MDKVYVVGGDACLLGPSIGNYSCCGCAAFSAGNCKAPDAPCDMQDEVLARIVVHVGTKFSAKTSGGRLIPKARVCSIEEWREYPIEVYWSDSTGEHIEHFRLSEFVEFKFL